ncbi:hypothetical protein [Glaciibacter superstes]|uniref:hypothetical protein n=1 Tax=Glaciibacter superstes TaxID=501023 RepID=UPI000429AB38|nr:hypothetical protein [Glaciibacter superstes]
MFITYLRRELAGRRKQTAIVAIGMALAIALVIIVNSVSSGVQLAQAKVLETVYGVGTEASTKPGSPPASVCPPSTHPPSIPSATSTTCRPQRRHCP